LKREDCALDQSMKVSLFLMNLVQRAEQHITFHLVLSEIDLISPDIYWAVLLQFHKLRTNKELTFRMRNRFIILFSLTFFLIDEGLLDYLKPIPNLKLDLNVESPPEEELPAPITSFGDTLPTLSLFPPRETLHLFPDHVKPFTTSSTEGNIAISPCPTHSNKRKCGSLNVEEQKNKFLCGIQTYENISNQQVGGACKDGKILPKIHESNHLSWRVANKAPMQKGEDSTSFQYENSQKLQSTTDEEGASKFFSVLDWKYVILEPDTEMSNQKCYASAKIHDQQELFKYLNKFNPGDTSMETFCIEKSKERSFFYSYNVQKNDLPYPYEIKPGQRYSAIQKIVLDLYDKIIPLQGSFTFVEGIKSLNESRGKSSRIERINKILKISTVFFIMYLSMFQEHEGEILREEQVISFMKIVECFLKGLAENESFVPNSKDSVEYIWFNLLCSPHFTDSNASTNISIAWKTVEYWMKATKKDSTSNGSPSKRYDYKFTINVLNLKIIFYSNLKKIYQMIENGV
jgi:hypothetical protein